MDGRRLLNCERGTTRHLLTYLWRLLFKPRARILKIGKQRRFFPRKPFLLDGCVPCLRNLIFRIYICTKTARGRLRLFKIKYRKGFEWKNTHRPWPQHRAHRGAPSATTLCRWTAGWIMHRFASGNARCSHLVGIVGGPRSRAPMAFRTIAAADPSIPTRPPRHPGCPRCRLLLLLLLLLQLLPLLLPLQHPPALLFIRARPTRRPNGGAGH